MSTGVSSKIYSGSSEFILDNSGSITSSRTFITAPTGICAVWEKVGTSGGTFHYIHTDNQGSWLKITNNSGTLENNYSYDAWGRPRNPNTWQLLPINSNTVQVDLLAMQPRFDRGYTGHEHMAGFGLINMNGRLYDPYLQRFLSPDPFVQSPTNTQSYNRYTYCYNNPLAYTDPSGYYPQGVLEGSSAGGSGFCSGGVFFGRPGQGGNGTGLNGVYYDWITGTYRSVEGGDEVSGPNIYSSDIFSSAYGQEAQDAYKGLASGTYSISLRDMGQKETLNTSGLSTYLPMPSWAGQDGLGDTFQQKTLSLPSYAQLEVPNSGGDNAAYRIANTLNEFNPIANLWDVVAYAFTGKDRFGNDMSLGQGMLKAAAVIPVGKVGSISVRTLQLTGRARTAEQGLMLGERFLGKGYNEVALGVFRSADGLRQFRMTNSDLLGKGFNDIAHIHFEKYYPFNLNTPYVNWHVPLINP